jgi:hypothetical protein
LGLLGRREGGSSFVGDVGTVASESVDGVGDLLETTIGKRDVVRAGGLVTVPVLVLAVVVVGGVVLDQPVEVVDGGSSFGFAVSGGGSGLVGALSCNSRHDGEKSNSNEALKII